MLSWMTPIYSSLRQNRIFNYQPCNINEYDPHYLIPILSVCYNTYVYTRHHSYVPSSQRHEDQLKSFLRISFFVSQGYYFVRWVKKYHNPVDKYSLRTINARRVKYFGTIAYASINTPYHLAWSNVGNVWITISRLKNRCSEHVSVWYWMSYQITVIQWSNVWIEISVERPQNII